jgi:hypothetical protein
MKSNINEIKQKALSFFYNVYNNNATVKMQVGLKIFSPLKKHKKTINKPKFTITIFMMNYTFALS